MQKLLIYTNTNSFGPETDHIMLTRGALAEMPVRRRGFAPGMLKIHPLHLLT